MPHGPGPNEPSLAFLSGEGGCEPPGPFACAGASSLMKVTLEGVKPVTLGAGLRAALKSREEQDVKLVPRETGRGRPEGRPLP